jgi:Tol biopolymer transport system component
MRRSIWNGVSVALLALVLTAPAHAAVENGKLAFTRVECTRQPPACKYDIWTVDPNGANATKLTGMENARRPAWSFDGQRLAFSFGGNALLPDSIYTVREDGSDTRHVLAWDPGIGGLSWSPDGSRLAAALVTCSSGECRQNVYTMRLDGSELTNITPGPFESRHPAWSPDGSLIAFDSLQNGATNIWTVNPDGTDPAQITQRTSGTDDSPAWSREGDLIVFASDRDGANAGSQLFTMRPDGTQAQRVTPVLAGAQPSHDPTFSPDGAQIAFQGSRDAGPGIYRMLSSGGNAVPMTTNSLDVEPDWQLATRSYQILGHYIRPKGAMPVVVSLVPAFRACATSNRVHGAPLAQPSCAPPAQLSPRLTIGTPDVNGKQARGSASARIAVERGDPSTLEDEADVSVQLTMRDVYRRSNLFDYDREVDVRMTVRITDRDNFPATGNDGGGTLEDMTLRFPASCVPTADASTGASCAVDTTLDSIVPGTVREGGRAVWDLGRIQVYDGGADDQGATDPNDLFQVQGLFVP